MVASSKFRGAVGFGKNVEKTPGVWDDVITEHIYRGDIVRPGRRLLVGDQVNSDIGTENSISIIADPYASEHFFAIRYVRWAGTLWIVSTVEQQGARLTLRLGGVYNGPTAAPSSP